jgi:hypothetical protein
MPKVDVRRGRIRAKIVYYGPGLSGKTTNLQYICEQIEEKKKGRLVTLNIRGSGKGIEVLPVQLGAIKGFDVTYNLCTVPGKASLNRARRLALKDADGVVFVADSRTSRMLPNLDSLDNLQENLRLHDIRLEDMPHVIQYNQRDRANCAPVADLRAKLNLHGVLEFEAVATQGRGVMETLHAVIELVSEDVERRL